MSAITSDAVMSPLAIVLLALRHPPALLFEIEGRGGAGVGAEGVIVVLIVPAPGPAGRAA
jgi:hypothetical protein